MSSSVFKTMFEKRWNQTSDGALSENSNSSDGNKHVITLTEDPETIAAVLNYMYTGLLDESKINHKLLLASVKYDMRILQDRCEEVLVQKFEQFEVGELIKIALATHETSSKAYQVAMVGSLADNWKKIKESVHYQDIKDNSDFLARIICHLEDL